MGRRGTRGALCEAGLAAVAWSYVLFAYVVVEYALPHIAVCPFFLLSGFHCPLCGSTRFLGMCLHGVIDTRPPSLAAPVWGALILVLAVVYGVRTVTLLARAALNVIWRVMR